MKRLIFCLLAPQTIYSQGLVVSGGAITNTGALRDFVSVNDYGALCDGSTDDTAAFQTAIAANNHVRFPARCVITGTLHWTARTGVMFEGDGPGAAIIWAGNNTDPVIWEESVVDGVFSNFKIQPKTASFPIASGILIEQGASGISTHNIHDNIFGQSVGAAGFTNFININQGAGGDNNNDAHYFANVRATGYTNAFARLKGGQVIKVVFNNCYAQGVGTGNYAVQTIIGASGLAASFTWQFGPVLHHMVSDFYIDGPNFVPITLSDFDSEGSVKLITTGAASGSLGVINLKSIRFSSAISTDPQISIAFPGPIYLTGILLDVGYTNPAHIFLTYTGGFFPASYIVGALRVKSSTAAAFFSSTVPSSVTESYYNTADNVSGVIPTVVPTLTNNTALNWFDTGGTARAILRLDNANNVLLQNASASPGHTIITPATAKELRFLTANQATYLLDMRESSQNSSFGSNAEDNYKLSVQKSGSTGTFRVKDTTASTGFTRMLVDLGAADSASTVTLTNNGTTSSAAYASNTNCANSASPAVCGSAAAGAAVIAAAATTGCSQHNSGYGQ